MLVLLVCVAFVCDCVFALLWMCIRVVVLALLSLFMFACVVLSLFIITFSLISRVFVYCLFLLVSWH